jgi:hypothetical protein
MRLPTLQYDALGPRGQRCGQALREPRNGTRLGTNGRICRVAQYGAGARQGA